MHIARAVPMIIGALLIASIGTVSFASPPRVIFDIVDLSDGISNTAAQAVLQDSSGFIWIGTQEGLNRYDGIRVEVFNFFPDEPNSLPSGYIYDLLEDGQGRIWVATDGGLSIFSPIDKTFSTVPTDIEGTDGLPHQSVRSLFMSRSGDIWIGTLRGLSKWEGGNRFTHVIKYPLDPSRSRRPGVRAISETSDGRLWVGTLDDGLKIFDPSTRTEEAIGYSQSQSNSTGDRYISAVFVDSKDNVWVGTRSGGLSIIDSSSGAIERHTASSIPGSLPANGIWKVYEDKQESIWIGTEGGGLSLWLPESRSFHTYKHDPAIPTSLSDDVVYDITQDSGDVLWVGTFNGVSKWNRTLPTFAHVKRHHSGINSISNNKISSFQEDSNKDIWIGTIGGGLNKWSLKSDKFSSFQHDPNDQRSISDNRVMSLLVTRDSKIWAGTMAGGINIMSLEGDVLSKFSYDEFDERSLSSDKVSDMLQDEEGRIWVATFGGGLNRYDGEGVFTRFPSEIGEHYEFPSSFIVDLELSNDGQIWVATEGGGLVKFDPKTSMVNVYQHNATGTNSISGNHIISLKQTKESLWVGTRDTGLNRLSDGNWQRFNKREGIASSAIYGILEDEYGRIWASHGKGISVYDERSNRFTNYNVTHGLQAEDFNNGASFKNSEGRMLFGGPNGFNIFSPKEIWGNRYQPNIVLSKFTKFNQETFFHKPAHEVQSIELDYTDYVIGFEFAALDYTDPRRNRYRYKLMGFDPGWVEAQNVHQATYTNLAPGNYRFRVQGSNNDGVWNSEGLSIDVYVAPPWWATWWAYTLYVIIAAFVLYTLARLYKARLHRMEQARYSQQLEKLVTARTQELEKEVLGHKAAEKRLADSLDEKEVLLKEVHHRVKNNMQVISSLLNIQADSVDDERFVSLLTESQQRIKSMALIHENLYRSDDLLEINFNTYVEMLATGLLRFYRFDDLVVNLKTDVKNVFLDIDTAVPCGLIINELVSNSLKHAYVGRSGSGLITIKFHPIDDGSRYQFSVADDGIGVPEDFNIEDTPSMGLEIVRILTEQLDGTLTINNHHGTEFLIEFPGG